MARSPKKSSAVNPPFPWDLINANALRTVCQQLGLKGTLNKDLMIQFLQSVETKGLDYVLNQDSKGEQPEPETADRHPSSEYRDSTQETTKPKVREASSRTRKRQQPDHDGEPEASGGARDSASPSRDAYNTRNKGTKRVRVTHEGYHLPSSRSLEKSASSRQKGSADPLDSLPAQEPRKRGRPRKNPPKDPNSPKRKPGRPRKNPLPEDVPPQGASVAAPNRGTFEGVVITSRRAKTSGTPLDDVHEDQDADGEEVDENDDLVDLPNGIESSLASSNKENDPFVPPDPALGPGQVHASIAEAINASNGR